jgi:hypothetical protein
MAQEKNWYKDGYFYRAQSPKWELDVYGFTPNGKGDLISNTMAKIIDDQDRSEWAYDSFLMCFDLLRAGIRWPDRMNSSKDAPNRIVWYLKKRFWKLGVRDEGKKPYPQWYLKLLKKIGRPDYCPYRPQTSMTRDPWILTYACDSQWDYISFIEYFKPPWWLYRPEVWAWRRALLGKWNLYKLWRWMTPPRRNFVISLQKYMDQALCEKD